MEPRRLGHVIPQSRSPLCKAVLSLPFAVVLGACATATSFNAPREDQPRDSVSTCHSFPMTKSMWTLPTKITKQAWSECGAGVISACLAIPFAPIVGVVGAVVVTPIALTADLLMHSDRCPAGTQTNTDAES